MADIPQSAEEPGDPGLALSQEFLTRKPALLERCKAAGLKVEDEGFRVVVLMRRGPETRSVALFTGESIDSLLSFQFEKYVFLSGREAICSYEEGIIEASVIPISSSLPNWHSLLGVRARKESPGDVELRILPEAEGLPIIEFGPASRAFVTLARGGESRMTLKLSGVAVKTHDAALELLHKMAGSLFFQLDMLRGVPLALERERPRLSLRKKRRADRGAEDLQYPKVQYDNAPLSLYWYGRSAEGMPLLQYLAFYQAIEFYFPVYSRSEAQRKLKVILKDPTFRSDRDPDIARLLSAIKVSRAGAFGDERAQLCATILECCDPDELRSFLEDEQGRKDFFSSKSKSQPYHKIPLGNPAVVDLRNDVAERVYEIRCKIVHTKMDARDATFELLLPFTAEAEQLSHDIELVQYLAKRVLISSSSSLNLYS